MRFLKKFDIIGYSPSLSYHMKSQKFKTSLGAILSILLTIICGIGLFFFGEEIWKKESPSVNISILNEESPGPYILDFKNFDFIIYLNKVGYKPVIDPRIYQLTSVIGSFDSNGSYIQTPLDLVRCNDTSTDDSELLGTLRKDSVWCVSRNQSFLNSTELAIDGYFGKHGFKMIVIDFFMCDNRTSPVPCLSQEEINAFLNDTYLTFNVYNSMIQTNNFTYPSHRSIKDYFFTVSNQLYISSNLYFNQVDILSDQGLVFSSIDKQIFYENDIIVNTYNFVSSKKFANLSFQLNNFKYIYTRNYKKIQDVVAQLGGILSAIRILSIFLSETFRNHYYYQNLINSVYSIKRNSKKESINTVSLNFHDMKKESTVMKFDNYLRTPENDSILNINMQNTKSIVQKYSDNQKHKITFDFHPVYIFFLCHKINCVKRLKKFNFEEKLFEKAQMKVKEYFLVENYLKIFLEIDKLKYFLLNFEQIALFDIMKSPIINNNLMNNEKSFIDYNFRSLQEKIVYDENELTSLINKLHSQNDQVSKKIIGSFSHF